MGEQGSGGSTFTLGERDDHLESTKKFFLRDEQCAARQVTEIEYIGNPMQPLQPNDRNRSHSRFQFSAELWRNR